MFHISKYSGFVFFCLFFYTDIWTPWEKGCKGKEDIVKINIVAYNIKCVIYNPNNQFN